MHLTPVEQARLREMGLTPDMGFREASSTVGQLDNLEDKGLIHKMITDCVHAIQQEGLEDKQPIDCHFFYMHALKFYYRHRKEERGLENAKYFSIQQIRLADKVIPAFKKQGSHPLPSHSGYIRLCIIYQNERKYREVMQLCQQAKNQGWNGDWDARYERAEKSLAKGRK